MAAYHLLRAPALLHFPTAGGAVCDGALFVSAGPRGDRLELHVPPGGECVGVQGLGSRRWFTLPAAERGVIVAKFIERMRANLARVVDGESPGDVAFADTYPGIHEFLGCARLADGAARSRSKLTIFYDGAVFKAGLTEPDAECTAFVTSDTFLGVLGSLEDGIQTDSLDWRRWWAGKQSGKSVKRG